MSSSIVFIVYVNDAPEAARFYADLLDIKPSFETPRYIAFELGDGADLALWSGQTDVLTPAVPRTSEVCLALPGGPDSIDRQFERWVAKGVRVVSEPHEEVFGRTFVVADPDGNLIRVAPVD
ncbi:VOC family protein [Marinitenerispora sediminis]|uniref:Glyoxalase n=1 Tax=Marinitenerispora sediminis TaxID=1931232 RepID=A0A368TC10_9ACTN|nr:VOC family protein [Marinitenerispora sediminis]RCV52059.1 glyoxalase [Marinitenerispora sediminis]RCV58078.1 glyoxalase [Marinitenerispora sediminis]RCV60860.1 glyoxalase [Marinitenerispora sediminis]